MTKRSAISLAALAAAIMAPAAYADPEPAVVAVAQQQEPAPAPAAEPASTQQTAPSVEAPESAPAPEHSNGCNTQRPNREGLALVLVPFDLGRQALRSLRGIFVSC